MFQHCDVRANKPGYPADKGAGDSCTKAGSGYGSYSGIASPFGIVGTDMLSEPRNVRDILINICYCKQIFLESAGAGRRDLRRRL